MAQILIRNMDPDVVKRLKAQAKRNGRSLQNEAKLILEGAAAFTMAEAREVTRAWRERFAGRRMADIAELIREDRRR